jgi:tRNA (adenine22-N1)-methyltransferase
LGYKIIQEEMVWEDGKFYPMMRAVFGKESYTPLEYRYGPLLLKNRHPVLKQYLEKEEKTLAKILVNLENQGGEGARQRYQEVLEEQKLSREALTYYDLQRDT